MPRSKVDVRSTLPFHITARCVNRQQFEVNMPTMWSIFEDHLYLLRSGFGVEPHAFVMMRNHFHLLASAPNGNMSEALNYFMRETSREASRLSGRINQTYGGRNHKTLIARPFHYLCVYKYIYRNPVRAHIERRAEDYIYSTLHSKLGFGRLVIPVVHDQVLLGGDLDTSALNWINLEPRQYLDSDITKALRAPRLRPDLKSSKPRKLIDLENELSMLTNAIDRVANWLDQVDDVPSERRDR